MIKMRGLGREVRLLSVVFGSLLWLTVTLEREAEIKLEVPVVAGNLPQGVAAVVSSPEKVEVVVSGPRILLCRLPLSGMSCRLDLAGAGAGTASFSPRETAFGLSPELKLVRVLPATVSLSLAGEKP